MSDPQATVSVSNKRRRLSETSPSSPSLSLQTDSGARVHVERRVDAQFASFKREEVAARHPLWSAQRITTELKRQWKAMSATEQQPWIELSACDSDDQQEPMVDSADTTTREPLPSKRPRASDEPRQPDTPYICFWKYARPEVVALYPHMSAPNVSREVGLRWRALNDDERSEWKDLAARDRQRYETEMAAYRKTKRPHPASTTSTTASETQTQTLPAPPKTGFQCFLSHNRESLTLLNMTVSEFRDEMSELWQRMAHSDKQTWLAVAAKDRVRYEVEMAALGQPVDAVHNNKNRLDQFKTIAKTMANAPSLPQTAYSFFSTAKRLEFQQHQKQQRQQHQKQPLPMKVSGMNRELSRQWKAMDAYDKLPYISKAQRDVERFVRKMEELVGATEITEDDVEPNEWGMERMDSVPTSESASLVQIQIQTPNGRWRRKTKVTTPRKPMNAYNIMYMTRREELMATYELSQNECSALCGRMWRQMADSEKLQYYAMAKVEKERYAREMTASRTAAGSGTTTTLTVANQKQSAVTKRKRVRATTCAGGAASESTSASSDDAHSQLQPQFTFLDSTSESSPLDDIRRLEESARAVFESAVYDEDDEEEEKEQHNQVQQERNHHLNDHHHQQQQHQNQHAYHRLTLGFLAYVESKRSEREHWTNAMWIHNWNSLPTPHRDLWEELAGGNDEHRRGGGAGSFQ